MADYAHVPTGPGIILISHQANIAIDQCQNRPGLLYTRKTPLDGALPEQVKQVLRYTLQAAQLLEQSPDLPGLKFATNELLFQINDRLEAPNTPETFAAISPTLQQIADALFAQKVTLEQSAPDPRSLFEIRVKASSSPAVPDLIQNLG